MSEENRTEDIYKEEIDTEDTEIETDSIDMEEGSPAVADYYYHADKPDANLNRLTDDELRARISARRRKSSRKRTFKKTRSVVLLIVVFALLFTMCGKDIVRLKAENLALKKQQEELTAERDRLRKELKETSSEEYIQDQARKQLRLLNEGEILFLFGEDQEPGSTDKDSSDDQDE